MKITFITPTSYFTGGIRVIYEHAQELSKRGHQVNIYYPFIPYYFNSQLKWLNTFKRNVLNKKDLHGYKINLKKVWKISDKYIDNADVVIATAWPTAYSVNNLSNDKGKKYYLIQHREIWSGPKEKVDGSWELPLNKIVISSWLKKLAPNSVGIIPNGVDFKAFYNKDKKFNTSAVIGMMYNPLEWKGFKDGYQAYLKAKEKFPNIKLYLFGINKEGAPECDKFLTNASEEEIRKLYCDCDIFISSSWEEGYNLTPMEAMACKCAVVATKVGAVPDYSIDGETALLCDPKNINQLSNSLIKLLKDKKLLKKISLGGYQKIKEFTWSRATDELLKIIY